MNRRLQQAIIKIYGEKNVWLPYDSLLASNMADEVAGCLYKYYCAGQIPILATQLLDEKWVATSGHRGVTSLRLADLIAAAADRSSGTPEMLILFKLVVLATRWHHLKGVPLSCFAEIADERKVAELDLLSSERNRVRMETIRRLWKVRNSERHLQQDRDMWGPLTPTLSRIECGRGGAQLVERGRGSKQKTVEPPPHPCPSPSRGEGLDNFSCGERGRGGKQLPVPPPDAEKLRWVLRTILHLQAGLVRIKRAFDPAVAARLEKYYNDHSDRLQAVMEEFDRYRHRYGREILGRWE